MKYSSIVLEEDDRSDQLYQRLITNLQDNLLTTDSSLTYDGAKDTKNEDISPTVEHACCVALDGIDPSWSCSTSSMHFCF